MASKGITYYEMNQYNAYLEKMKRKRIDFSVTRTTYTRKIQTPSRKIFFNDSGEKDYNVLHLISKVRKDCRDYVKNNGTPKNNTYIHYFDIFARPDGKKLIKVDINSAYWQYAILNGIITKETNEYLKEKYSEQSNKKFKGARLKALGSLATTKTIEKYHKGVRSEEPPTIKTEETKPVYMDICRGVDQLLRDCVKKVDGCIYYYWDCIFTLQEYSDDVVKFFAEQGYATTREKCELETVKLGKRAYLLSKYDDKCYMVRREDAELL